MTQMNGNADTFDYQKSLKKSGHELVNRFIKVEKYINRPLGSLLVKAIFNTGITPNQLTVGSFFLFTLAAFFFSRGEYAFSVLAGALTQLASIIDSADGMLARSKNMCSHFGSCLDLFLDRVSDFFLITTISLGQYLYSGNLTLLILGLLTAGLYMLQVIEYYITNNLIGNTKTGETGEARALFLLLVLIFSIAHRLDILIYLTLAETIIVVIYRFFHFLNIGFRRP